MGPCPAEDFVESSLRLCFDFRDDALTGIGSISESSKEDSPCAGRTIVDALSSDDVIASVASSAAFSISRSKRATMLYSSVRRVGPSFSKSLMRARDDRAERLKRNKAKMKKVGTKIGRRIRDILNINENYQTVSLEYFGPKSRLMHTKLSGNGNCSRGGMMFLRLRRCNRAANETFCFVEARSCRSYTLYDFTIGS